MTNTFVNCKEADRESHLKNLLDQTTKQFLPLVDINQDLEIFKKLFNLNESITLNVCKFLIFGSIHNNQLSSLGGTLLLKLLEKNNLLKWTRNNGLTLSYSIKNIYVRDITDKNLTTAIRLFLAAEKGNERDEIMKIVLTCLPNFSNACDETRKENQVIYKAFRKPANQKSLNVSQCDVTKLSDLIKLSETIKSHPIATIFFRKKKPFVAEQVLMRCAPAFKRV